MKEEAIRDSTLLIHHPPSPVITNKGERGNKVGKKKKLFLGAEKESNKKIVVGGGACYFVPCMYHHPCW